MVTAFCHQLGWKNMEILVSQFQDRLHFGIHSELLELMKLSSLNGVRARALFDSGFETISSIASADGNIIENILHKAVPFQSEKEREDDDSDDVKRRNKFKSIWITGCCGMTAKEAAQKLIIEARKYLENEIGVSAIKWNTSVTSDPINRDNEAKERDSTELIQSAKDENLDNFTTANSAVLEQETHENKCRKTSINILENSTEDIDIMCTASSISANTRKSIESENITVIKNHHQTIVKTDIGSYEKNVKTEIDKSHHPTIINDILSQAESAPFSDNLPRTHTIKEEIVWDSLTFTEGGLENITKLKTLDKIFSPNISFGDTDKSSASMNIIQENLSPKSVSVKDTSLFSTDGETSIFEESLPLDLIASNLFDNKSASISSCQRETTADFADTVSKSILNAFKSPLVLTDEDEDIKLVFDYGSQENNPNLSKEDEVVCSQEKIENTKDFKSPYKRRINNKEDEKYKAKKKKLNDFVARNVSNLPLNVTNFGCIKIKPHCFNCFILKGNEIYKNLRVLENSQIACIYLSIQKKTNSNEVIGANILNIQKPDTSTDMEHTVKGIAICLGHDTCIFIDLTSLENKMILRNKMFKCWFENGSTELKTFFSKWCFLKMKKWLDISLPSSCVDVSLTEWLIDSDEKMINIEGLVSKNLIRSLASVSFTTRMHAAKFSSLLSKLISKLLQYLYCI